MLKLKRNHPLLVWAYLLENRERLGYTTLCTVFWRTVLWTPLLKLGLPSALVSGYLFLWIIEPWNTLVFHLTFVGIISFAIGVALLGAGATHAKLHIQHGIIGEAYRGFKQKYCHIIHVE